MSDRVNLGELRQRGIPLFTREAAAVLHEVCSRLAEAEEEDRPLAPPALTQLWVTAAGELAFDPEPADPGDVAQSTMTSLAALIEALLPPTIRNQPDYAVPGSFRVLAPRARGFPPGLPPVRTPAELDAAVTRYRGSDPTLVLQQLFARIASRAEAPASAASVADAEPALVAPMPATADSAERADVASRPADNAGELEDQDLPLNVPQRIAWVRPLPPSNATGRPRRRPRLLLAAAAAMVMVIAFTAGYQVTRRMEMPSETTARAVEPATPVAERHDAAPVGDAKPPVAPARSVRLDSRDTRPTTRAGGSPNRTSPDRTSTSRDAPAVEQTTLPPPTALPTPASSGPVFSPSFAASGSALVFHAGRDPVARLMSAEIRDDSSPLELVTIVSDNARNYHPRVSPDGRLLAFDSDRDGQRGVYISDRDGTHVRRVSGAGFAAVPSWSPDMRALAFVRAEIDRPRVWNLWSLDQTTGAITRLTRHPYGQTWGASWFPDSRRLCYSHEDRLVVLDIDDGTSRVFRSPRAGRLVRTPAVSPDGRLVAFQVLGDGVWLLHLGNGVMRRLIEDPSAEEFAWDPNGGRLAYHSRRSGEWRIWIAATPPALPDEH